MNYYIGATVFRDWKITRELGEGAYGKVFEIQKSNYGITVISALKVLQVPRSQSDVQAAYSEGMDEQSVTGYFQECVERLVREIAILSELKGHANIMGLEDYEVIQRTDVFGWDILIRMELLTSLQEHQRNHPLSEEDVIRLGRDLCSALSFCHKRNLIHRDIKPANIFVGAMGQYKLGDFGVSRNMEATVSNLSKAGTESYMAPEVYQGRPYSPNVDLYSLGLVLFQLSNNGRLPFLPPAPQPMRFSDRETALRHRMNGEALPTPAGASVALADVIRKACAFDPCDRYQTADEMLEALNAIGQTSSPAPGREEPAFSQPDPLYTERSRWNFSGGGLDSLDDLGDDLEELPGSFEELSDSFEGSTDQFGTQHSDEWDEEEKTEATLSVFGNRSAKKPDAGHSKPQNARQNPSGDMFGHSQPQPAKPTPQRSQTQPAKSAPQSAPQAGGRTPTVYYDRRPSGINQNIARMFPMPSQAEVWVTREYMNRVAAGTLPGAYMTTYFSNGTYWAFSGNTLKGYMTDLQNHARQGIHTITVINRFPELGDRQETLYLHLLDPQPGQIPIAQYDGVSSFVLRWGASGTWILNSNANPSFFSDVAGNASGNPFYGITSFLHHPPKKIWMTSALAELGTSIVLSGYREPKKVMTIDPMKLPCPPQFGCMRQDVLPGQPVNIAEFFRVENVVSSPKLMLYLPEEGKIYTAMMKHSAKEGKFTLVERYQSKYASLKKTFD